MRHLHEMVVHDVCQMVCREFVSRLIEHLIVEDVRLDAYHATYEVVDYDFLSRIDEEAHHILLSLSKKFLHLFLWQRERVSHIHTSLGIILEVWCGITRLLQLLWGIERHISLAIVEQLLNVFLVDVPSLGLSVRSVVATE